MSVVHTPQRKDNETTNCLSDEEQVPLSSTTAAGSSKAAIASLINLQGETDELMPYNQGIMDIRNIKLPPFWTEEPALWFAQADAQFHTHRITSDATRYFTVIAKLNTDTLRQVSDLIHAPPNTDKYGCLKRALIECFTDSKQKRLTKLLTEM